jgi:hypothetical protein
VLTDGEINDGRIFKIEDVNLKQDENVTEKDYTLLLGDESGRDKKIVLFNSNSNRRDEIVSIRVDNPWVDVVDDQDGSVLSDVQISIVWPNTDGEHVDNRLNMRDPLFFIEKYLSESEQLAIRKKRKNLNNFQQKSYYQLMFQANLPALSTRSFTLRPRSSPNETPKNSKVTLYMNENESSSIVEDSIRNNKM